ncbi:serine hydrolase [Comamonadaceae bacterium G21597-S1]|nr:serine hydrolase [Comamonadaceae bacterium G21597-S1]
MAERWLVGALDYIPRWIEWQMRVSRQPGCAIAIWHRGRPVLAQAFGHADLARGQALTNEHRFRVASHSKTFTAAGLLRLRETGHVRLDQPVGDFVSELHPDVARVTLSQLLSHSAGLVRDGFDAGQWQDRRPFLDEAAIRADLAHGTTIPPNSRFKYSNHGYGLLGMVIATITGEPYADWITRAIVRPSGLADTVADAPVADGKPLACGHSSDVLLGQRVVIPGDNPTRALASATGFVSTASDLARFFGSLSPQARSSVLSVDSRREMARRQWRDPHASLERWYGLGTISGTLAGWDWFGHSGGFQGHITRTVVVPEQQLSVSVLTNASDGLAHPWLEGALHILARFARDGAPPRRLALWNGRWCSLWGAFDLLPVGDDTVLVANPALANPLQDASEITPGSVDRDGTAHGSIRLANGFANHGESVRLERDARQRATTLWLGGNPLLPEAAARRELARRYGGDRSPRTPRKKGSRS